MFLSQPGSEMLASYHWAPITVSIESAIRSRDCSEKLMPSVPIEMPSLTPIVLNRMPTMPGRRDALLHLLGQVEQVHVAGVALVPDAGDADLRLVHVLVGQAGAVEHRLRRPLRFRLRDARAELVQLGHDVSGLVPLPRHAAGVRAVDGGCADLFFDAHQLVVLGDALGPRHRSGLDVARPGRHRQIRDEGVFGFAGSMRNRRLIPARCATAIASSVSDTVPI